MLIGSIRKENQVSDFRTCSDRIVFIKFLEFEIINGNDTSLNPFLIFQPIAISP